MVDGDGLTLRALGADPRFDVTISKAENLKVNHLNQFDGILFMKRIPFEPTGYNYASFQPADGGAMTADERHRSHQQPRCGIDAQQSGHGNTDQVLKCHERDREAQEDEQGRTTAHQVSETRIHSHRGEEVHQQKIARIEIEAEVGSTDDMQKCEQQSDQKTS